MKPRPERHVPTVRSALHRLSHGPIDALQRRVAERVAERYGPPHNPELVDAFVANELPAGRWLIYGAGTQSRRLLPILRGNPANFVAGFLDQNAELNPVVDELNVRRPDDVSTFEFDHVLVSHEQAEPAMQQKLMQLGVAADCIYRIYGSARYQDMARRQALTEIEQAPLPDRVETLLLNVGRLQWQVLQDAQLSEFFDPRVTVRGYLGRSHMFQHSALFPTLNLRQSTWLLDALVARTKPRRIYLASTIQMAPASLAAYCLERYPGIPIDVELYDWALTFPTEELQRVYRYDEETIEEAIDAETVIMARASRIVHKNIGPYWRPLQAHFQARSVQLYPVPAKPVPSSSLPRPLSRPIRLVYAGTIAAPSGPAGAPVIEQQVMDVAPLIVAAGGDVELDAYNAQHLGAAHDTIFAAHLARFSAPPVRYHRAVPPEQLSELFAEFDYGLMLLGIRANPPRWIDHVGVGNKFCAYIAAGLPVIVGARDRAHSMLVKRFSAGIVIEPGEVDQLTRRVQEADHVALRSGAQKLAAYMHAVNKSRHRRLTPTRHALGAETDYV